jgi:hypothetical protein
MHTKLKSCMKKGKFEGKRLFGRQRLTWENNIKGDFK